MSWKYRPWLTRSAVVRIRALFADYGRINATDQKNLGVLSSQHGGVREREPVMGSGPIQQADPGAEPLFSGGVREQSLPLKLKSFQHSGVQMMGYFIHYAPFVRRNLSAA